MKSKLLIAALALMSVACSQASSEVEVEAQGPAIWDIDVINAKVERINSGESFAFYDNIKKQADSLVNVAANPSVMDKLHTPASGDKHDYMSIARYWWPNPDTADGLPYVRHDGESNPEVAEYDRNSLARLSNSVSTLSLAYYISGEAKYADKAVSRLRTWFIDEDTRMNPNLNFAQIRKGQNNDSGSQYGVLDGYSYVSMLDAVALLELKGALPKDVAEGMQAWFAEFTEWLVTSELAIAESNGDNNHAVAYDTQLIRYAMYGGRDDLARRVVNEFPARRMDTQIEPDGSMPIELERATAYFYTRYNIEHMIDICDMASKLGIDLYPASNRAIERAIDWMVPYSVDQSTFPYRQIHSWDSVRESFARLLYRASSYGKQDEYKAYYNEHKAEKETAMFEFLYLD